LPYSQDFREWTGNYFNNWINATVTTGQADPFGGTGANLLTGYYSRYSTTISVVAGATYTFSVWLKNSALVNPIVIHILSANNGSLVGGNSLSITAASIANWTRYSVSYTIPASGVNQVQCGVEFGSSKSNSATGYSVFVYGGMLEQSTTVGSYVSTNGTPNPVPTRFGDYRIHTYTATGTSSFVAANTGTVEVLVVGGGGSGGANHAGGGGGGGIITQVDYPVIAGVSYPVVVGAGGTPAPSSATAALATSNGGKSQFGSLVAAGGGAGGNRNDVASTSPGQGGGSGGGGGGAQAAFALNYQPGPGMPGQGNAGGVAVDILGGGGGGAGSVGQSGPLGGRGGHGLLIDISGAPTYYSGGGGGGWSVGATGAVNGGLGGGGNGGYLSGDPGTVGRANTGGGGGGGGAGGQPGSAGGSGIVIVRYRSK
jgi:hypothetical protein